MPEIRVPFRVFSPSSSIHGLSRQPNPFAPFLYQFYSVAVGREAVFIHNVVSSKIALKVQRSIFIFNDIN